MPDNVGSRIWVRIQSFYRNVDANAHRPFPYHPIGSVRTHGEVADSEGKRLEELFDSV